MLSLTYGLLIEGGVTPNGTVESPEDNQFITALINIINANSSIANTDDSIAGDATVDSPLTVKPYVYEATQLPTAVVSGETPYFSMNAFGDIWTYSAEEEQSGDGVTIITTDQVYNVSSFSALKTKPNLSLIHISEPTRPY